MSLNSGFLVLAYVVALVAAFVLGYLLRSIRDNLKLLMNAYNQFISDLADHGSPEPEPKGKVVEPADAVHDEWDAINRRLNG